MKRAMTLLIAGVVSTLLAMTLSCSNNTDSPSDSIIQVKMLSYETGKLELASYGAVFKDEYHALIVIDYERYNPESIVIITGRDYTYEASLEAVDPRSGLAILKTQRPMNVPAILIENPPDEGETVLVWEPGNEGQLVSYSLNVTSSILDSLVFILNTDPLLGPTFPTGTMVTGTNGKSIGLIMPRQKGFYTAIPRPFVASLADTPKMLSGEYDQESWIDGPVNVAFRSGGRNYKRFIRHIADYEKISDMLAELTAKLGEPVIATGIDFNSLTWNLSSNGTVILSLYPNSIELSSTEGKVLAQARWIAIEWNRGGGQPDRLIYGTVPYATQGAFELSANLTGLEELLFSILE